MAEEEQQQQTKKQLTEEQKRAAYNNFLSYLGPKKAMYEKMCTLPKRGPRSMKAALPAANLNCVKHMARTMKHVRNGKIPVPPDIMDQMTLEDRYHFKYDAQSMRRCQEFLRTHKNGHRAATLLGKIVNSAIRAGHVYNGEPVEKAMAKVQQLARGQGGDTNNKTKEEPSQPSEPAESSVEKQAEEQKWQTQGKTAPAHQTHSSEGGQEQGEGGDTM